MHFLFLSKYLAYTFICGNFIHNAGGRALPLYMYPIQHFYKPFSQYDSLLDNTIFLISTLSIFIDFSYI